MPSLRPKHSLFLKVYLALLLGLGFTNLGLALVGFANASKLNVINRGDVAVVQMPEYARRAFRKTLDQFGSKRTRRQNSSRHGRSKWR